MSMPSTDLEQRLSDLARETLYPRTPALAAAVRVEIERRPSRIAMRNKVARHWFLLSSVAALLVVGSLFTLSPGMRSAAASWFHLPGVQIEQRAPRPGQLRSVRNLGTPVPLAQAREMVGFHVLTPRQLLGNPGGVYIKRLAGRAPAISLLYGTSPGPHRPAHGSATVLITEFRARFWDAKLLADMTTIEPARVRGDIAVWLAGAPHAIYYVDLHGRLMRDTGRLAGNTLLWQHGTVTIRIESKLSLEHMLAVARSMR